MLLLAFHRSPLLCLPCFGLLSFAFPYLHLLSLAYPCFLPAAGASEASPAWLAIPSFVWLCFGFPCFSLRSIVLPCFLLLRFSACCLALSFEWFPGVPSVSLAFPCFLCLRSLSLVFTSWQNLFKNVALPVHLLRQVFFEGPGGSFFRVFFQHRFLIVF